MTVSKNIAFLGLGVMGGPMTGHLARAGHTVTAYNRSSERAKEWAERWSEEGLDIAFADTPAEAARNADIVFSCVVNDEDMFEVLIGADAHSAPFAALRSSSNACSPRPSNVTQRKKRAGMMRSVSISLPRTGMALPCTERTLNSSDMLLSFRL